MTEPAVYRYLGGVLHNDDWCDPAPVDVLVADSWSVVEGSVVALDRHLERFRRGLQVQSQRVPLTEDPEKFLDAVLDVLPTQGEWFPRIEWVQRPLGGEFRFHHRPRPAVQSSVVVRDASMDPRTYPQVKGPDLARMNQLRAEASRLGAGEALLMDDSGQLSEGAYSSLAIWPQGRDEIWIVESPERIPSITESVVVDIARSEGIPVLRRSVLRGELDGAELWVMSALHGIRLATAWQEGPALSEVPGRRDAWQALWQRRAEPISDFRSPSRSPERR